MQLSLDNGNKKPTQQGTLLSLSYKIFSHVLCNAYSYSTVFALLISVVKTACCNCLKINQQLLKLPSAQVEKYCKPQWLTRFFCSLYPCQFPQGISTYWCCHLQGKSIPWNREWYKDPNLAETFALLILHGLLPVHGEVMLDNATPEQTKPNLCALTYVHWPMCSLYYDLWEWAMAEIGELLADFFLWKLFLRAALEYCIWKGFWTPGLCSEKQWWTTYHVLKNQA